MPAQWNMKDENIYEEIKNSPDAKKRYGKRVKEVAARTANKYHARHHMNRGE